MRNLFILFVLSLSLAACGGKGGNTSGPSQSVVVQCEEDNLGSGNGPANVDVDVDCSDNTAPPVIVPVPEG
jgi:uncharacterized protein YcfL